MPLLGLDSIVVSLSLCGNMIGFRWEIQLVTNESWAPDDKILRKLLWYKVSYLAHDILPGVTTCLLWRNIDDIWVSWYIWPNFLVSSNNGVKVHTPLLHKCDHCYPGVASWYLWPHFLTQSIGDARGPALRLGAVDPITWSHVPLSSRSPLLWPNTGETLQQQHLVRFSNWLESLCRVGLGPWF